MKRQMDQLNITNDIEILGEDCCEFVKYVNIFKNLMFWQDTLLRHIVKSIRNLGNWNSLKGNLSERIRHFLLAIITTVQM